MPYYRVPIPLSIHGTTDAFNVRMFGNAFTDKSRDVSFSVNEQIYIPVVIRADQRSILANLTLFYPPEDIKKIDSGELSFHVCGKVTYEDIFGEEHETTFWYIWDMEVYEMGGGARHEYLSWKLNGPPETNRAS